MQDTGKWASPELQAVCGPRFNTFGPAKAEAGQRPCVFFAPKLGATDRRQEDASPPDAERWDGQG